MPAVNFGPGDPTLAHTQEENVPVRQITGCFDVLKRFLLD
jgi:succinyl-diaminopimelate desuccinylase